MRHATKVLLLAIFKTVVFQGIWNYRATIYNLNRGQRREVGPMKGVDGDSGIH